jgi:purine-binding chemotaxis protein CheW
VIIVDYGVPLGFVVDRVAAVVSVEPELIDSADTVQATVDSRILSGVIKQEGGELLAILDVAHVIDDEFDAIAQGLGAAAGVSDALALTSTEVEEDESDDTFEMVSFIVDGQEYALPIDQIQEIVQASNSVSEVPNADPRVLGVMDLRGRLLPLVSLRRIFGLNQQPLDESSRIVVVPLRSEDGRDAAVGVVMDTVREVLRVPRDLVDAVPSIVARDGRNTDVESVCRLDGGERLVSVLSTDRLFSGRGLQAVIDNYDDGDVEDMADAGTVQQSAADDEDQQLVVFRVDNEEYCLGVDSVQEIIRVPEHLIRVPRALDFVEGLVNLRGTVLPVIDLRSRLGLARCERDDLQRIVVVIIAGVRTGFVVDAVAEVIKLDHSVVQAAPELSQAQARLISSVANLEDSQRMLMLLDHTQLLGGAELQALAEAA